MKMRLLLTTAVGVVLATTAFAQSPKDTKDTTTSPTTQTQAPQKAPETSTSQAPSSSTTAPAASTGSQAQTTPSTSSQPSGTSAPAQAQTTAPAPSNNQAQQAPSTQPAPSNNQAQQAPAASSTNQAQQAPSTTTAQQPSQNTAQQPSPSTTAQQPAQTTNPPSNTAQSSSTNVNASVNINDQQRTRVTQSISRLNVQPLTNVNFSLSVGTAVPRDIRLQTVPAEVVDIVPQYRGYSFFVVRDEIVIVEPSTYKIVTVLPRSGGSTAAAPAQSKSRVAVTDKDRDVVRKHFKTRPERQATGKATQTTGTSSRVVIRRGERLPDTVEMDEFPETVYRDAPTLRDYRFIHRENRTYLVDPVERTVIDDFD